MSELLPMVTIRLNPHLNSSHGKEISTQAHKYAHTSTLVTSTKPHLMPLNLQTPLKDASSPKLEKKKISGNLSIECIPSLYT